MRANADVKAKSKTGDTALLFAAMRGNAGVVNTLLQAGAAVNEKNASGLTPLMAAATVETLNTLIKAGADINARDNNGKTALMFAAQRGNEQNFNLLRNAGLDIKETSKDGTAMLAFAAMGGNEKLVDLCLEAGFPVNPAKGTLPLTAVSGKINHAVVLKTGIDPAYLNQYIMDIVGQLNINVVKKLLTAGADVNGGNPSPLFNAVQRANVEVVQVLLEAGADPAKRYLVTPQQMLEVLQKNGIDLTEEQMIILEMLQMAKPPKGKFPHPHTILRSGLLKTLL